MNIAVKLLFSSVQAAVGSDVNNGSRENFPSAERPTTFRGHSSQAFLLMHSGSGSGSFLIMNQVALALTIDSFYSYLNLCINTRLAKDIYEFCRTIVVASWNVKTKLQLGVEANSEFGQGYLRNTYSKSFATNSLS